MILRAGDSPALSDELRRRAWLCTGETADYDPVLDLVGSASIVLIGEASHGTHEFYRERARITKRLIEEKGFTAVAVEADWPDADRVHCYVTCLGHDRSAIEALAGFERFPQWMWRNADVVEFVEWLRLRNLDVGEPKRQCGFYGMDLYSLHGSMRAVLRYLDRVDPEAARRARCRYACFDHTGEDPQAYGYVASVDLERSCEDEVVRQLLELRQRAADYARRDGRRAADAFFSAEQNARLVRNAEVYYRSMFRGRQSSWNLRDRHMAETLDTLMGHLASTGVAPKIVVWAHNSHLGDARATEMGGFGELNVGQLVRERFDHDAVLIGQTTHAGVVTAASDWDAPAEYKTVLPSRPDSWERVFHDVGLPRFIVPIRGDPWMRDSLKGPRLERAIGVIYAPATERASHYFEARLAEQFDLVLHIDETTALEPIERVAPEEIEEPAETFPSGM
jgi:erythromycin esterase-like protein